MKKISIHALREEGDKPERLWRSHLRYFYPRPPRGGRHWEIAEYFNLEEISIHALREEGDDVQKFSKEVVDISIHALREEGDHRRIEEAVE